MAIVQITSASITRYFYLCEGLTQTNGKRQALYRLCLSLKVTLKYDFKLSKTVNLCCNSM